MSTIDLSKDSGRTVAESVLGRWEMHCKGKLDWAFEAYAQLMNSLSSDIHTRMAAGGEEAYVVVFGRTQVGKTTLLLELMGVKPSSLDRVSNVLRGGRGKGQSATATVMEYGRSVNAYWSLHMPQQSPTEYESDAEACAALRALREQMERQQLHHDQAVRLDIPANCFGLSQQGQAKVRMLDLPGDQASNPIEQQHVARVAERYVAGADLILLVGKMDDLSFLKPGGVLLPGIEDWQIVPQRFRIVTTYSFTPLSVQSTVRKLGLDIGRLRARMLDQMETFGRLSPDARRADLLFPLEFGESLARTASHDPDLVAQISPLVADLKAELTHHINDAVTPRARLRAALDSHVVVTKVKEQTLQDMDHALGVLRERQEADHSDLKVARAKSQASAQRLRELLGQQAQLESAPLMEIVSRLCANIDETEQVDQVRQCAKSVKSYRAHLDGFRAWLRDHLNHLFTNGVSDQGDLAWFWGGVRLSPEQELATLRQLMDEHLGSVEDHLANYSTDGYMVWWSDNFANDGAMVRSAIRQATGAFRELVQQRWRVVVEDRMRVHRLKVQHCIEDHSRAERLVLDVQEREAKSGQDLHDLQHERMAFVQKMAADQARCLAFVGMLDASYQRYMGQLLDRMHQSQPASLAFMDLLGGFQLMQTRRQLLDTAVPIGAA